MIMKWTDVGIRMPHRTSGAFHKKRNEQGTSTIASSVSTALWFFLFRLRPCTYGPMGG